MLQYEVVFSDSYILDTDAESSLAFASSYSSAKAKPTSVTTADASTTSGELSTLRHESSDTSSPGAEDFVLKKPETYEYMMLDSNPYLCALPLAEATKNGTEAPKSKDDQAKELARATDKGWELLKELEGNCMYFVSGWWSYSFCYNNEVKQFHALPPGKGGVPIFPPTEDETVPSFVLGHFGSPKKSQPKQVDASLDGRNSREKDDKSTTELAQIQTKGDMRYMVQKLSDGTTCDITGRPRRVEVQFHCHPQSADRIGWIKEVSTCAYLMVIYTPRLCNDVAFQPPKEHEAQKIVCKEIIRQEDLESWRSKKAKETERKLVGLRDEASTSASGRPIVGGIEVGGMQTVGQEGKRIDAPKVFHPAEAQGEIVAKWSPTENEGKVQRMKDEHLRDLDLNPVIVDEMLSEIVKLSGNQPWQLEVVENQQGERELRGIMEMDDEELDGDEGASREKQDEKTDKQKKEIKGKRKPSKDESAKGDAGQEEGSEETFKEEL